LAHDLAEIVGLPSVEEQQGARFVIVETLELAIVQAIGELLVNEKRKASGFSQPRQTSANQQYTIVSLPGRVNGIRSCHSNAGLTNQRTPIRVALGQLPGNVSQY
jgi:hypothetical protein